MPKKNWLQYSIVGLILIVSFLLMLGSSLQESPIMDELAHIPAGYGYVKYMDYRLNPEHPPLVKAIAALPLLAKGLHFPTDSKAWQSDINGQWVSGALFLYESGNNADVIVNWARLGPMLLTLLLIFFVFFWSNELMGPWWALLPTTLIAFSPTVLAHGHYVTTDIGASLGVILSLYYFTKFMQNQSKKNLLLAGIAYGLAQALKFSAILLIPLLGFLIIVFAIYKGFKDHYSSLTVKFGKFLKEFVKQLGFLIGIFIIGYLLVYLIYTPLTWKYPIERQHSDTVTILNSFSTGPDPQWNACKLNTHGTPRIRCLADIDVWMTEHSFTKPFGEYVLGVLMVIQRASGGNYGYFLGEVSSIGWWYYFPVVFAFKETIPTLILIALAFLIGTGKFFKNIFKSPTRLRERFFSYIGLNFAEFSMLSYIVLYWVYSMKSPLNIGIRHVLPTIPLMYIVSSQTLRGWAKHKFEFTSGFFRNLFRYLYSLAKSSAKISIILVLLIWFLVESFLTYPYYLSYFNEFAGGTLNGYRYVTDSNYDWGQDLKRLAKFVDEKKIDKIAVNYFGGGDISYYMPTQAVDWYSAKGNPKSQGINWIAISVNNLQGSIGKPRVINGKPEFTRKPGEAYEWLFANGRDPYKPDYRVGTTIFVYKLTDNK